MEADSESKTRENKGHASDRFFHVPEEISSLYEQASEICETSPRASVSLSRCCLEKLLGEMGYRGNLARMIEQAYRETRPWLSFSTASRRSLSIIRFIGNIAAHPVRDGDPLKLVEPDIEEAEWCLRILEKLLDEYYEEPESLETRMAAYEGELISRGRRRRLLD